MGNHTVALMIDRQTHVAPIAHGSGSLGGGWQISAKIESVAIAERGRTL